MLGPRIVLGLGALAACVALFSVSSCSGAEFTGGAGAAGKSNTAGSAPGGTDSGGSAAGGSSSGGDAGETSSGGSPDPGGSGGSGGTASGGCDCNAGYYCRDGTADCRPCAELNRLNFLTPQRLATVSDNGQGSHFPRVGSTGTDLLYRLEGTGLRYTADASTSSGNLVQKSLAADSGPLLLSSGVSGIPSMTLLTFNFVFDRLEAGKRSLYAGQWNGGGLEASERLPAPYNGSANDYSMAVATQPSTDGVARAFWMTTRNGETKPALLTARIGVNEPAEPVDLAIGKLDCPATDTDPAPWVTSNGKTLLVSHQRLDAQCSPPATSNKDIYIALLPPATGLPSSAAVPMSDVNSPMNDVEPSFSGDMCDLYFASDRDGKYALYRAHRR